MAKTMTKTLKDLTPDEVRYRKLSTEHQLERAEEDGMELIEDMAAKLESAAREMRRYKERYADDAAGAPRKSDVLSWVANEVCSNILGGLRVDMLITTAAEIERSKAAVDHYGQVVEMIGDFVG